MSFRLGSAIALFAFLFLTACQNYKQTPVSGVDQSPSSAFVCPPGSCAGAAPDENSMTITSGRSLLIYYNKTIAYEPNIQLAGDCYASTFPNNRIDIYLNKNLASNNLSYSFENSFSSTVPRCIQGKYNIMLNTAGVPSGSTVQLKLVGIDSTGKDHMGPTGTINLTVYSR